MNAIPQNLPVTLQQARKARRLSQLELSMRVGVSQRHVSYVESGRAKPSRELLLAWLQELNLSLVERNAAMLQAGYAPVYSDAPLDDPSLAEARLAIVHLLETHEPMPAFVLDAHWNLRHLNRGGQWLAATLMPWMGAAPDASPMNMLDALCHPDGLASKMVNIEEVGPAILAHLRNDARAHPVLRTKVDAFAALLQTRVSARVLQSAIAQQAAPMLTTRFATAYGVLSFFSMFSTFGTPQDITLASLRVEHLFAADDATRDVLAARVPRGSS
jgi:transcriptional regulator with XRE-family HTH domain